HRADIDGEKLVARARCRADRTKKSPRGAVDGERQRIDQKPGAVLAAKPAHAVAVARHQEQKYDVAERNCDDDPALQHPLFPTRTLPGAQASSAGPASMIAQTAALSIGRVGH